MSECKHGTPLYEYCSECFGPPPVYSDPSEEITLLRAALADAQAVGFAAGVEAAAARVLLDVWPTDASFDAAFNACAASYHGGDQMQDVMDRTLATVSAALRAIAGDTP